MEINRLRQFCALAELGHLRQSAELLNLSPGALSKSMKVLQEELGVKLFTSNGRALLITDQGRQIYTHARRVISDFEFLLQSTKLKAEKIKPLRIASFELFTTYFMGEWIERFQMKMPLNVIERVPGQIEESVSGKEADFGITYAPVPRPDLDFLKICSFEKGIFVRRGMFKGLSLSEIPFSTPTTSVTGSPTGITSLDGWPEDFPRKILYRFELLETALVGARLGLAAIFCPKFIVPLQNRLVKTEFQLIELGLPPGMQPVRRSVFIVKRKTDPESAEIKSLARALRQVLRPAYAPLPLSDLTSPSAHSLAQ